MQGPEPRNTAQRTIRPRRSLLAPSPTGATRLYLGDTSRAREIGSRTRCGRRGQGLRRIAGIVSPGAAASPYSTSKKRRTAGT